MEQDAAIGKDYGNDTNNVLDKYDPSFIDSDRQSSIDCCCRHSRDARCSREWQSEQICI